MNGQDLAELERQVYELTYKALWLEVARIQGELTGIEAARGERWQQKQLQRAAQYRARFGVKSIQAGPHVAHAGAFG